MCEKIKNILDKMTLEEKVTLLTGKGLWRSAANHRLNIPDFVMTDGTYGVRYNVEQIEEGQTWSITDFFDITTQSSGTLLSTEEYNDSSRKSKPATCFPNGSSLGCSWDRALVEQMGQSLGRECQYFGVDVLLGPGINTRRTPLGGRGYEYYSEDPIISGELAASLITGLQSEGVGASLKHFACNNSEIFRTTMDSIVEERALREIYLQGFEIAVKKSKPWTIMSSYNKLNGIKASEHKELLTHILRDEWGWDGVIVSDWGGISNRPQSILAGSDLDMPESKHNMESLITAVNEGLVPMAVVDNSCIRMLELINKIMEHRKEVNSLDFSQHHRLARKIASESMVLLKNEGNILPLHASSNEHIAVIGRVAKVPVIQGSGCATTIPTSIDIPLDFIEQYANITYADGYADYGDTNLELLEEALTVAKGADKVVVFVSTEIDDDGEGADRKHLGLIREHEILIEELSKVSDNVIVVIANSEVVTMPWIHNVQGALMMFYAGQGMGSAVADILFGKVNPSGKLSATVPITLEETPAFLHYPGEHKKHIYSEGIYVGYRYYDKRKMTPQYPFGYGLSYTNFTYSNMRMSASSMDAHDTLIVHVDVTNSGKVFGKEIIQLYVKECNPEIHRTEQDLRAFHKVGLAPNETKTVTFQLSFRDFAFYHPPLSDWVVSKGDFEIRLGKSSRDIVLSERVFIDSSLVYYPIITTETECSIIVQNPFGLKVLADLIAEKLQISYDQSVEIIHTQLVASFYGIAQTLSIILDLKLATGELEQVIDKVNRETLESLKR